MTGNRKGAISSLLHVEHTSTACEKCTCILECDRRQNKKLKLEDTEECEVKGGGATQNNCTFARSIGSTIGSIGEAVRTAVGNGECMKEEERTVKEEDRKY